MVIRPETNGTFVAYVPAILGWIRPGVLIAAQASILPGEFRVAEILFTSGTVAKKCPVLVLWLDGKDAVVAAVTSAKPRSQTDVDLQDWAISGLRVASTVRLSRLSGNIATVG